MLETRVKCIFCKEPLEKEIEKINEIYEYLSDANARVFFPLITINKERVKEDVLKAKKLLDELIG